MTSNENSREGVSPIDKARRAWAVTGVAAGVASGLATAGGALGAPGLGAAAAAIAGSAAISSIARLIQKRRLPAAEIPTMNLTADRKRRLADEVRQGNTKAMMEVARALSKEPADLAGARDWYERAAEAGDASAMENLANLLANRLDPPELEIARIWYQRAAEAGDSSSMVHLGDLLANRTYPPDPEAARFWYQRAAEAGDASAIYKTRSTTFVSHRATETVSATPVRDFNAEGGALDQELWQMLSETSVSLRSESAVSLLVGRDAATGVTLTVERDGSNQLIVIIHPVVAAVEGVWVVQLKWPEGQTASGRFGAAGEIRLHLQSPRTSGAPTQFRIGIDRYLTETIDLAHALPQPLDQDAPLEGGVAGDRPEVGTDQWSGVTSPGGAELTIRRDPDSPVRWLFTLTPEPQDPVAVIVFWTGGQITVAEFPANHASVALTTAAVVPLRFVLHHQE